MADSWTAWSNEPSALLAAGLTVFLLTVCVLVFSAIAMRPRIILRRRMASLGIIETRGSGKAVKTRDPEQRRIQERLRELEAKGKRRRRNFHLRTVMLRAGLDMGVKAYLLLSGMTGLIGALVCLGLGYQAIFVLAGGLFSGLVLPRLVLGFISGRRQAKFTREFPNALDILVRGVRSGLPVTECLEIIGREMPEPVGEEFRRLVDGQKMGVTLEQMLTRALDRMPTAEFKFFAIVIQVQQQIGGSLADTLENLSHVLRERKKMRDKASAMAAEGKASATIIGAIPVTFALILSFINPDYLDPFFEYPIGKVLFYSGLIWMGVGMLVMRRMINIRI